MYDKMMNQVKYEQYNFIMIYQAEVKKGKFPDFKVIENKPIKIRLDTGPKQIYLLQLM